MLNGRFSPVFISSPHKQSVLCPAQAWGFFVRQTGRGAGNILTPRGRDEILTCLNQYIATEEARPSEEQFSQPPLAEVIALRDDLTQQRRLRHC
jgi:hypothetical protein